MKKKIIGFLVVTILIGTVIPVTGFNNELKSGNKELYSKGDDSIVDVGEIRIYNDSEYGYRALVNCYSLPQIKCTRGEEVTFKCRYYLDAEDCTWAKAEIWLFEEDDQEAKDYANKEILLGQNLSGNISVIITYNPTIADTSTYCNIILKGSFEKDGSVNEDECQSGTELSKSSIKFRDIYFNLEQEKTKCKILFLEILQNHPHLFPLLWQLLE